MSTPCHPVRAHSMAPAAMATTAIPHAASATFSNNAPATAKTMPLPRAMLLRRGWSTSSGAGGARLELHRHLHVHHDLLEELLGEPAAAPRIGRRYEPVS